MAKKTIFDKLQAEQKKINDRKNSIALKIGQEIVKQIGEKKENIDNISCEKLLSIIKKHYGIETDKKIREKNGEVNIE